MIETNVNRKDITLDTNVIVRLIEAPNYVNMLATHSLLNGCVHITDVVMGEIAKKRYNVDDAISKLEAMDATVTLGYTTADMCADARAMEGQYAGLHHPDSRILAYAKSWRICLVTCDRDLAEAAGLAGVDVVNPDTVFGSDGWFSSMYDRDVRSQCRRRGPDGNWVCFGPGPRSPPDGAAAKRRRRHLRRRAAPRA